MTPDKNALLPQVQEGDKVFAAAAGKLAPNVEAQLLGQALRGIADRYASNPPPATFRLITSPLVTWIWLGAIIVFLGGLIAIWPGERDPLRRRAQARYAARIAKELGRMPRGAVPTAGGAGAPAVGATADGESPPDSEREPVTAGPPAGDAAPRS